MRHAVTAVGLPRRLRELQAAQGWGAWPACSRKLGLRGTTPPKFKPAPQAGAATAKKAAATAGGATVAVQAGDTLAEIAKAHGLNGWEELHRLNPGLTNPNKLRVGQTLNVG